MTDAPDTSAEAVERLARTHDAPGYHPDHSLNVTAATLRDLSAEREALRAEVERLRYVIETCARGDLTTIEKGRIARAALTAYREARK